MTIAFIRPEWLLALPVIGAALWYAARGSYADLMGARRVVAWVLRCALLMAMVLALAGAQLVRPAEKLSVVFAVDESYSVSQAERERALSFIRQAMRSREPGQRAALVVFGRQAMIESESMLRPDEVGLVSTVDGGHTDLAGALRLGLGLIAPDSAGRIVLCSDGNENRGRVDEQVIAAEAARVAVDVLPLSARSQRDALVSDVSVPAQARRDEPFTARVEVSASEPSEGKLMVLVDDQPVTTMSVTLAAGTRSFSLPVSVGEPGFHRVDVALQSAGDECAQNNIGTGFVRISGDPRVLVVDSAPDETAGFGRALRLQDVEVKLGGRASLPTSTADLEGWDAVILSDFPAYDMTRQQMEMLRDATRDLGIGLGMIGGEYGFGAGGYYDTAVAEALPVSMDVNKQRAFPAAAVLIVMDTSGSMGMEEDGYTKIALAAEAGCAIVDLLQPYDSVGFIASDPAPTEVAPLRKLQDKQAICDDIRSVRAGGGGISVFPSLQAAYGVLREDKSPVRHIIMLADGSDCDEQEGSVPLVEQMMRERITVTTVAFGDGPHVPFLQDVAAAGRGQFYLTEQARDLKAVFTREALKVAKSVLVEEPFRARPADASELTTGFDWASAPPLAGYVAASPKDLARTALVTHKDDPLLAQWQFGLGRSVAFTSDAKAHWAAYWLRWPEFTRFWGQTVRWMLRRPGSELLHPRLERDGDQARLVVDALDEDAAPINGLEVHATMSLPGGGSQELSLSQSGPGTYDAPVEALDAGAYVAGVHAAGPGGFSAQRTMGFAVPYPPDYADVAANQGALERVARETGGVVLTDPAQAFAPPEVVPHTHTDIWRSLLWLAALLLPLDIAVRRLNVSAADVAAAVAMVRQRLMSTRPAADAEAETVEQLLRRRQEVRADHEAPPARPIVPPSVPQPSAPPAQVTAVQPQHEEAEVELPAPDDESLSTTDRLLRRKRERDTPR